MRRFSTATVLGGLLLLGASGSLAASDTPKVPRPAARRKAVASKLSKIDVKLENLYVDSEIGQVFTVNLGRADQPAAAGETASLGSVQIYQLGGSETEPPATDPADPAEATAPADDDEAAPAEEMQEAPEAAEPAEAAEEMEPAADDSSEEPAAEPAAAPEAAPQADPNAAKPPAAPATKEAAPQTPPPAASPQTPPPPPPPIR